MSFDGAAGDAAAMGHRGDVTGAMGVVPGSRPPHGQDAGARKRQERERARLLEREHAARLEAEAANARLGAMQALTDTALSHLALDDLLRELLGRVTAVMGVDHAAILLLDEDGRSLTMRAAHGPLETEVGRARIPVGQGFAGGIAASREPLIVDDTSAFDAFDAYEAYPLLRDRLRSVVGVPLLVEEPAEGELISRLVGVVHVGSATPRRFAGTDVQLLQRAADRVALAIGRARLYASEREARRRAEAALAWARAAEARANEHAERLHTILETLADGVVVCDAAGRAVHMNRACRELFALDRAPVGFEALPARQSSRLLHVRNAAGAPLPFEATPVARALRGEVVTGAPADVRVRAFDGRELDVNSSAAPLREPDGRVVGAVVVVRDTTERNRLARSREAARADELAARAVSQSLEALLAVAAHDLRSPLTATLGFIDLAARQTERLAAVVPDESPDLTRRVAAVRGRLDEADRSVERLSRLLALLFDTAAIRAGKLELHRAAVDLAALAREQVEALRAAAPERAVRLHAPAQGGPLAVAADADRIGQVVANYLGNALKYAPPDRPIDVYVVARRGRARVAVCDRGPGIPPEERTRVWELLHRAPGVVAQGGAQGGSLGLGLSISRAIITAHGGRVGVKSVVGEGSTFWFTLPLSDPTPGAAAGG